MMTKLLDSLITITVWLSNNKYGWNIKLMTKQYYISIFFFFLSKFLIPVSVHLYIAFQRMCGIHTSYNSHLHSRLWCLKFSRPRQLLLECICMNAFVHFSAFYFIDWQPNGQKNNSVNVWVVTVHHGSLIWSSRHNQDFEYMSCTVYFYYMHASMGDYTEPMHAGEER